MVDSYIDRALSAKTVDRPDFQRMIKDSTKGIFDVIIVWKLDRFVRNCHDSTHYKAIIRKNGVKVISAPEAISEGAEGILLESLLEGLAEYYECVKSGATLFFRNFQALSLSA
jgi:DNA invertase Pin-like site-specific DNA recombinase